MLDIYVLFDEKHNFKMLNISTDILSIYGTSNRMNLIDSSR